MNAIGTKPTGPFAILRIDKIKSWAELNRVDGHNARLFHTAHVRPSTSPDTHVQLFEVGDAVRPTRQTTSALIKDRLTALSIDHPSGVGGRAGTVIAIEILLTASNEFFANKAPEWINGNQHAGALAAWIDANVSFLRRRFGKGLVSYAIHLDEDTPHIHAIVCPVIQKQAKSRGRPPNGAEARAAWEAAQASAPIKWTLSARDVLGVERDALAHLQDEYGAAMQHLGLARGAKHSTAKHKAPAVFRRELAALKESLTTTLTVERDKLARDEARQVEERNKLALEAQELERKELAALERAEKLRAEDEARAMALAAQTAEAEQRVRALLRTSADLERDRDAHQLYLQGVSAEQAQEALRLREEKRQLAAQKKRLDDREQIMVERADALSNDLAMRSRDIDDRAEAQRKENDAERQRINEMRADAEQRARVLDTRDQSLRLSRQKAAARLRGLRVKLSRQRSDLALRQKEGDELRNHLDSRGVALDAQEMNVERNRQQAHKTMAQAKALSNQADALKAKLAISLERAEADGEALTKGLVRNELDRQENQRVAEENAKAQKRLAEQTAATAIALQNAKAAETRANGLQRGIEAFLRGDIRRISVKDGKWWIGFGPLSADAKAALQAAIKPVLSELAKWMADWNERIATLVDRQLESRVTPEQVQAAARERVKPDDIRAAAERAITPDVAPLR
jgi:hypothetical protein